MTDIPSDHIVSTVMLGHTNIEMAIRVELVSGDVFKIETTTDRGLYGDKAVLTKARVATALRQMASLLDGKPWL